MISNKEYLKWSGDMDRKVKQVEQEEIESEKSPNSNSQIFVLQREEDERDRELGYKIEDEAFDELQKWNTKTINLDDSPDEIEINIISQKEAEKHPLYVSFKEEYK